MIQLDIVAGFLGAGKTTFINKLLSEGYGDQDTVLIENEFGDVSVDGDLIESNVRLLEMTSGCICCTLQGDFVEGITRVAREYQPRRILIEPTGAGNLQDVLAACQLACQKLEARINSVISIVSAETLPALLMAGGDFFRRQLLDARYLVMSCTQLVEAEELAECRDLLADLGIVAGVRWEDWSQLDALEVLTEAESAWAGQEVTLRIQAAADPHHHHHHHHGKGDFLSLAFRPSKVFSQEDLDRLTVLLTNQAGPGKVFRGKGFLRSAAGMLRVEYVFGARLEILASRYAGAPKFVIIGQDLAESAFRELLE